MTAPRYALYTLPSVGDHFLWTAKHQELSPAVLVTDRPHYWSPLELAMVDPDAPDLRQTLQGAGVEFVLVIGWSRKLPPEAIDWLPKGGWNVHPSLLPDYRGYNPYFWVIEAGETQTGITVHRLTQRFDEGPVLFSRAIPVHEEDTSASLFDRIVRAKAEVGLDAIDRIHHGRTDTTDQPAGTFVRAPKVRASHLQLKPTLTVEQASRLIRAANPDHGARIQAGTMEIKVLEASTTGLGPRIRCADGELVATVVDHPVLGILSGARLLRLHRALQGGTDSA